MASGLRLVKVKLTCLLLAVVPAQELEEGIVTNFWDEDPLSFFPWDKVGNRPVQLWKGDYDDVKQISCKLPSDLLFDWLDLKRGMSRWLKEVMLAKPAVMQIYWEQIRPIQHALTNIVAHHNTTSTRDCILGMLSVRAFYLVVQSPEYRNREIILMNNFVNDWHYMVHKFKWSTMILSGWASVIFPSYEMLQSSFIENNGDLVWIDCEALPRSSVKLPMRQEEVYSLTSERWHEISSTLATITEEDARKCPVALAYASVLVSTTQDDQQAVLNLLDEAQRLLRYYREKNDFTYVNLLHVQWPIWHFAALTTMRIDDNMGISQEKSCQLLWCKDGGTPNPISCQCEILFPETHRKDTVCFYMSDTRRKSSLRNITSILNARFWTLAFGINRAYAEDHGYEIDYVQPDNQTHFPGRKVGWGKVKVMIDSLRERGPERCAYGVSIDTDAFMRTSEPLSNIISGYGLDDDKLILFSQEYHTEHNPGNVHANGGFFIVRNSPEGVGLLEEWYNVPEDNPELAHLKKENPQGLNLCWDLKMQPKYSDVVVLAEPHLFTAPFGWVVRHNWFKDLRFEQEMQDILLQRLQQRYNCIMCQNVYDWDDSNNTDPGWR
eukprot:TRINITY_DN96401_c0_g1_i1.p1 TRINITY_DN96401_c0_g1~~TRINITY_DN96401_c0_g1_i1.p1  ORF type:complete len:607 (+),score=116.41 TRINITY_DN96401_c0_g1_i1:93-1913(+)